MPERHSHSTLYGGTSTSCTRTHTTNENERHGRTTNSVHRHSVHARLPQDTANAQAAAHICIGTRDYTRQPEGEGTGHAQAPTSIGVKRPPLWDNPTDLDPSVLATNTAAQTTTKEQKDQTGPYLQPLAAPRGQGTRTLYIHIYV